MKSKLQIYFLPVLLVMFLLYGYSTQDNPNTDSAPYSDYTPNNNAVTAVGDTLYTFVVPSQLILGVNRIGTTNRLAFTSGGQSSAVTTDNIWIRTDLRGNRIDSFPQVNNTAGQGFGFRDLTMYGQYLLTSDNNTIRRIDTATFTEPRAGFTGPNNPNRGLARSSVNRIWTSNFTTGPVAMIDTNGATIKSLGIPTVAPYGLAADVWTTPGRMWLWYAEPSTAGTYKLSKVDTSNGAIVQSFTYSLGTAVSSGGIDIFNNHPEFPGRVVAVAVVQNSPASRVIVVDLGPDASAPPPGGTMTVCRNGVNLAIPDNTGNAGAVSDNLTISGIPAGQEIKKIKITVQSLPHTWIGDVRVWVKKGNLADTIISRPGWTGTGFGNSCDNFTGTVLFDSVSLTSIQNVTPATCATGLTANSTGNFLPKDALAVFQNSGTDPNGTYTISVSDNAAGDTGTLNDWCVTVEYGLITGVANNTILANEFKLSQNYPNPFNPATTINYTIPKSGLVTLKVFDILGKEVASLVNGMVTAGSHSVNFNASQLSSGVYFYRIESGNFVDTKKMFLLK